MAMFAINTRIPSINRDAPNTLFKDIILKIERYLSRNSQIDCITNADNVTDIVIQLNKAPQLIGKILINLIFNMIQYI